MTQITFGKDRYHLNDTMAEWCGENIGPGRWTYNIPVSWKGMDDKVWVIYSMFGNTTFAFKNERDYTWFVLRWS